MSNVLDLDSLKTTRSIRLNGRERKLNSMTVGQFIDSEDLEKKVADAKGREQAELLIAQIMSFLEDTAVEELRALEMPQLMALLAFIRGTDLADIAGAVDDDKKAKAGKA